MKLHIINVLVLTSVIRLSRLIFVIFFNFQPSMDVFNGMLHDLEIGRDNSDGADQGFLVGCYPDLLNKPMFHPPENGTKLNGTYRLPLGYLMDASYYCECHRYTTSIPNFTFSWLMDPNILITLLMEYCRS
jgi:hypothetical protein